MDEHKDQLMMPLPPPNKKKEKKLRHTRRVRSQSFQVALSSSERGRLFRARRKGEEQMLLNQIVTLRDEIAAWEMRRSICEAKYFQHDENFAGSLGKLIKEYTTLFKHGFMRLPADLSAHDRCMQREHVRDRARRQEEFLKCVADPNVAVGNLIGIDSLITQWHLYTSAHASFTQQVTMLEVVNADDCRIVIMHSLLHGRITPSTFRIMFPNALRNGMSRQLYCKLMNRPLTYNCITRFHFTEQGKIIADHFDVDFASALLSVPFLTPQLVASLLDQSTVTVYSTLEEDMTIHNVPAEVMESTVVVKKNIQPSVEEGKLSTEKMRLSYVLSKQ